MLQGWAGGAFKVSPTAGGGVPPGGWPHCGEVEFQEVSACYRPGLPPVLSALSFTIKVQMVQMAAFLCSFRACLICGVSTQWRIAVLAAHCNDKALDAADYTSVDFPNREGGVLQGGMS